jgi:hypothetical protein
VYQQHLVGPVPQFPREIEERIDRYLRRYAALEAERDMSPPHTLITEESR